MSLLLSNVYYEREGFRSENQQQINPSINPRFAIGYNSEDWYLGLLAVSETIQNKSYDSNEAVDIGIGNLRLNYVKRFTMGKKTKNFIDKLPLP